ncbi:MAG: helix-turn-helix domain-containing protein [Mycobacterium sp.]
MTSPHPSEQTRQLLRRMAEALAQNQGAWLDDLAAESLKAAGMEAAAADPVLRASAERAFRASFLHWATQNIQNPGASVGPGLGDEVVHVARDLIRGGLEETATTAYRVGQSQALRYFVSRAFEFTGDPVQLRELLDTVAWSISDFVESTVTSVTEMMRSERAEILRGSQPELRETVALLLDGAPITPQRAESRLGYRLSQAHTAVVVWSPEPDVDVRRIDDIVETLTRPWRSRPLIIRPGASTKWVWLPGPDDIDRERLRTTVDPAGSVRVAVGGRAVGVDGFRRSHADATAAQRMVARLDSAQRVVFFDEVQLVALMTSDAEGAERFVRQILGDLAYAPRDVRETVLAFVEEHGSVSRVATRQYTHRNTVVRRVARAEALLPRPLAENPVQVAAALQVLRGTGHGRPQRLTSDHG